MSRAATDLSYVVRPYQDGDEERVLELLDASLGGGPAGSRPREFFRWKHHQNPFGASYMLVAEIQGRIVGLRAYMRWRFLAEERAINAVRAVDTATHPEYQGRGIFSELTRRALEDLRGEVDLIFNTPNEKSLPGYLKMGWQRVGAVPVALRVRRPLRFVRNARHRKSRLIGTPRAGPPVDAQPALEALRDAEDLALLLEEAHSDAGLTTPRTPGYLRWRYGEAPLLNYRVVQEERNGRLLGLAIFRVRPRGRLWESTVAEVIVRSGDRTTARRILRRVIHASAVDHVTCSFPPGSAAREGMFRSGFLRSPWGMTLVANPLREDISPDPLRLRSWALSLGDLEVF